MNKYLTIEEMKHISDEISKQEGQNYPCSNQIVTCGFFASKEIWDEFCDKNKYRIKERIAKNCIRFEDGETWRWYSEYNGNIRGFRFYKIKVDSNVNREVFLHCIYPCCVNYCKEIEWI